ncbi:HIT family protein [Aestuariivivens sediminicola]|uniref:HIT family protein n=1 Tax=Aestuariivivens sediminicola TaxID=2913560 RepID=UPI001F563999|nr:HIT family protein [Aestuariivivens sediminicola]
MSVFSEISPMDYVMETENFFVIYDQYPVSPGHILIISKKQKEDFFNLDIQERTELADLIVKTKKIIDSKYTPDGYNIGMNCGEAAGQTVMHFHCHMIPRYIGDMDNPRGGIRHCVSGKGYY